MKINQVIHADAVEWLGSCDSGVFDAIVTDPPYGVTQDDDDYVATDWLNDAYRVLKDDAALLMCVGQATLREFWNVAEEAGFIWFNTIVWWHRNSLSRQTRRFTVQYDPILYLTKGKFLHRVDSVRVPYRSVDRLRYPINNKKAQGWRPNPLGALCSDVWEIPAITTTSPNGNDTPVGHKWQKPIMVMKRMVECCCGPGSLMLDPLCGSGTSLIAARFVDVNYVGIDNDPLSVELSKKRLAGEIHIPKGRKPRHVMKDIFDD